MHAFRALCSWLCVLALAAPIEAAAPADPLPTVDEIAAHVRTAEGVPVPNYREVVDAVQNGSASRTVTIVSGGDFRMDVDEGPIHSAWGSVGGQAWHQNANGETVLTKTAYGDQRPDLIAGVVTRVTSPVNGYAISSLDADGFGTKRYVDATTWRVLGLETVRASGTTLRTYDDFRTVGGHTVAFHQVLTDGHPEDSAEFRVAEFAPIPIDRSALAVPKDRRVFVEFPAGTTSVDLPVREDHNKFFVRVTVGNRGLDFLLDSGASGIYMEDGTAKQLGLTLFATHANGANAGRFLQSTAIVPEMKVGSLTMHDVVVGTLPKIGEQGTLGEYRAVGLLGFDFIDAMTLKLDYFNGTLTAYSPGTFVPPAGRDGFTLDVRLDDDIPHTTVTVNGVPGDEFLIDTGAAGSLIIINSFMRRHPAAMVDEGHGVGRDIRLEGVGGELKIAPYQLAAVKFGGVTFHDFVAYAILNREAYDDGEDGTIGPEFLTLFDVYFDYAHAHTYMFFSGS